MAATVDSATQTTSEMSSDGEECDLFHEKALPSPRVVIDTSPPFASVEEAVSLFGRRCFWIPAHLDAPPLPNDHEKPEMHKLEDRAAAMLNDLHMKEQETLEILTELELTKRLVQDLKLKLPKEAPNKEYLNNNTTKPGEQSNSFPTSTAGLIMMELKQAKLNIYHNTNELASIRASVESLTKKMDLVERDRPMKTTSDCGLNPLLISRELRELNYEAEQFMKTAEAARSEVLKAMSDIENTKTGLKVIEMRWVAAKKLKEAARAAESLALAEIRALSTTDNNNVGSESEYDPFRKIEEDTEEKLGKNMSSLEEVVNRVQVMNRRSSFQSRPQRDSRLLDFHEFEFMKKVKKQGNLWPTTTSIGDILSRKLVLDVGRQREGMGVAARQRVSLNQMLRQQRGETSPPNKRDKDGGGEPKKLSKRKALGLGFVHISLPLSKPNKNKIQALNLW